ncbi:MAG: FlgD immunoglobulin-like domain containing protein [bacterium]|nr:FlgD immunoglobulin-like domain containing protein [bacterium]
MKIRILSAFLTLTAIAAFGQKITIQGNRFYEGTAPVFLNGVNTPWNNWNDFGGSYDHDWWNAEFTRLKEAHVNCVRVWIHCDGGKSPLTDADGFVSGATEAFWTHMDDLMDLAFYHEIYVLPALWSFDMPKTNERYKKMLADTNKVQSYIDHFLIPLVERYDGAPYLLAWEICNEPEWIFENYGVPQAQVIRMHAMIAAAIHEHCSEYVTTGSACVKWNGSCSSCVGNLWSDASLKNAHPRKSDSAFLDFWQVHYYSWQDPWFSTPMARTVSAYGVPDDRPVLLGEMSSKGDANRYIKLYENGFDGGMGWTSNGVDDNGSLADLNPTLAAFYAAYPDLVDMIPSGVKSGETGPSGFRLRNYPNPFNSETVFSFELPEAGGATLTLYTSQGLPVRTLSRKALPAGPASLKWNGLDESGRPLSSGVYVYRFSAGDIESGGRLVLLR